MVTFPSWHWCNNRHRYVILFQDVGMALTLPGKLPDHQCRKKCITDWLQPSPVRNAVPKDMSKMPNIVITAAVFSDDL